MYVLLVLPKSTQTLFFQFADKKKKIGIQFLKIARKRKKCQKMNNERCGYRSSELLEVIESYDVTRDLKAI